jgi:hypothetical protein
MVRPSWNPLHNPTGSHEWVVNVALKEGDLTLNFGWGPPAERRARDFISSLRVFMEEDALRNAHNAVMRKGKGNG